MVVMDPRTNLYIFEKKEVVLVLLFMVLVSLTSFMLGVKLGRSAALAEDPGALGDRGMVEIMSAEEENAALAVEERRGRDESEARMDAGERLHRRLEERIESELGGGAASPPAARGAGQGAGAGAVPPAAPPAVPAVPPVPAGLRDRRGKYTIQLGSYRSEREAREFADGFVIKGYEPIVQDVEVPGRGRWFRVSLGEFDGIEAAKAYVAQERELFLGQDYVFGQFE